MGGLRVRKKNLLFGRVRGGGKRGDVGGGGGK